MKKLKCAYCSQEKEEPEIWGYSEGEDEKGDVKPDYICKECHKEYE